MLTNHEQNAKVFKALCDCKRLAIIEILQSGEKCACKIIEDLDIAQSALSYHMKILCESGIVQSRNDGKWIHYQISQDGAKEAIDILTKLTTTQIYLEKEGNTICK